MKIYVTNAFSLSMLDRDQQRQHPAPIGQNGCPTMARVPMPVDDPVEWLAVRVAACRFDDDPNEDEELLEIISAIGHPDTAAVLSGILHMDLPPNRVTVKLEPGTYVLVGQYIGSRLSEGATTLPEGARIEWWSV